MLFTEMVVVDCDFHTKSMWGNAVYQLARTMNKMVSALGLIQGNIKVA
jgi:hypothetical protein